MPLSVVLADGDGVTSENVVPFAYGDMDNWHLPDDVPDEVKTRRLSEIIALQNELSEASNRRDVGREFEVLVERCV